MQSQPPKTYNTMIDLRIRDFYAVVIGGSVLSSIAGYINAATMIGLFSTTVSHLTGTVTRLAVASVQNKWDSVLRETTILLGFAFGSFICGIIVRNSKFRLTRRYGTALLVESVALFITTLLLYFENYIAPVVAAFSCGLQNGLTTGFSGAVVRTTHVTGTVTDITLILGQNLLVEKRHDLWKLKVLVPLLLSYLFGGMVGVVAFIELDYLSFLIPSVFTGALGLFQIAINSCQLFREAEREKEKRAARARAKRATKIRGLSPEFEILLEQEVQRRLALSRNIEMNGNVDMTDGGMDSDDDEIDPFFQATSQSSEAILHTVSGRENISMQNLDGFDDNEQNSSKLL